MTASLRIDKYLWFIRFLKTRSMAAALVEAGGVTVNGRPVGKPAQSVKPGDEITVVLGKYRRRIQVAALGDRRGPAPEAQSLYRELAPPEPVDPWE